METKAFQADSLSALSTAISAYLTSSGATGVSLTMSCYNATYQAILMYTPA